MKHTRSLSIIIPRRLTAVGLAAAGLLVTLAGLSLVIPGPIRAAALQATGTLAPVPTETPTTTSAPLPSATPTEPAPTLVPPTPLPEQSTPLPTPPPETSALARVQADRVLRVGTLFNAYPFSWLNEQGLVAGYEAEILRAIGIELGVEVEFIQVTRNNAADMLLSGQVDVLTGQQMITRDRLGWLDFSHPYYLNEQRMVVVEDSAWVDLPQLAGQPVSVCIGSTSERALRQWSERTGITFDIRTYFTESDALDALALGEVQGMVGELDSLRRAGRVHMRLIDESLLIEPYAIAVRKWDANTRNILNRSLQRLNASGRLEEIFAGWFPGETMDFHTLVPVYDALYEDARTLDQLAADMPYPAAPVQARMTGGQPIRVAGVMQAGETAPAQVRITNAFNQALITEMAARWGVPVEFVPGSASNAVDLVASGQADIAVGTSPRWDDTDRVEYSIPYIEHGDRLLAPENAQFTGFRDMKGTGWWIGYFADDPADADHIREYAEMFGVSQNIRDPFTIQREEDGIYTMTVENNISAIYGDSLRLEALLRESNATGVKILDDWYGAIIPVAFAMPRNDADFRNLVDATLQDMARDGTYQQLWAAHFGLGDPLPVLSWPLSSPMLHP